MVLFSIISFARKSGIIAKSIIKHLGLQCINNLIIAKPGTTLVIADKVVIRLPHDEVNIKRCHINKEILNKLKNTGIASSVVPRFLSEGEYKGQAYFCESRISGSAIDIPISKIDHMVNKAGDFIFRDEVRSERKGDGDLIAFLLYHRGVVDCLRIKSGAGTGF